MNQQDKWKLLCRLPLCASAEELKKYRDAMLKSGSFKEEFFAHNENNCSVIEFDQDAAKTLVEPLVNGMEALLDLEYNLRGCPPSKRNPRMECQEFYGIPNGSGADLICMERSGKVRDPFMKRVFTVNAPGSHEATSPTICFRDKGIGIRGDNFFNTILTFGEGFKALREESHGHLHNGSARALRAADITLFASRVPPSLLKPGEEDMVAITCAWKDTDSDLFSYKVLVTEDGNVPTVPAHLVKEWDFYKIAGTPEVMTKDWGWVGREDLKIKFEQGTLRIAYNYQLGGNHRLMHDPSGSISQLIATELPSCPMPHGEFEVRPCPNFTKKLQRRRTMLGALDRLVANYRRPNIKKSGKEDDTKRVDFYKTVEIPVCPYPNGHTFHIPLTIMCLEPKEGRSNPLHAWLSPHTNVEFIHGGLGQRAFSTSLAKFLANDLPNLLGLKKDLTLFADLRNLTKKEFQILGMMSSNRTLRDMENQYGAIRQAIIDCLEQDDQLTAYAEDRANQITTLNKAKFDPEIQNVFNSIFGGHNKLVLRKKNIHRTEMKPLAYPINPFGPTRIEIENTFPLKIRPGCQFFLNLATDCPDDFLEKNKDIKLKNLLTLTISSTGVLGPIAIPTPPKNGRLRVYFRASMTKKPISGNLTIAFSEEVAKKMGFKIETESAPFRVTRKCEEPGKTGGRTATVLSNVTLRKAPNIIPSVINDEDVERAEWDRKEFARVRFPKVGAIIEVFADHADFEQACKNAAIQPERREKIKNQFVYHMAVHMAFTLRERMQYRKDHPETGFIVPDDTAFSLSANAAAYAYLDTLIRKETRKNRKGVAPSDLFEETLEDLQLVSKQGA